eukprot:Blabericola_migrator_1__1391@NODE_1361_length_4721_cov_718_617748_g914_i0_p4_GENE_NODE_1361_length_4721_cov_718_617748_g914_i0NODE_1361_length_4721_cov_718_617748_g914_i0_p4_ORF_typecomplete_len141_score12_70_NODE_1361_length_4721_cov_718_617748_g914_i026183040
MFLKMVSLLPPLIIARSLDMASMSLEVAQQIIEGVGSEISNAMLPLHFKSDWNDLHVRCSAPFFCTLKSGTNYYNPYKGQCARWIYPFSRPNYPEFVDACSRSMAFREYLELVARGNITSTVENFTATIAAKKLATSLKI